MLMRSSKKKRRSQNWSEYYTHFNELSNSITLNKTWRTGKRRVTSLAVVALTFALQGDCWMLQGSLDSVPHKSSYFFHALLLPLPEFNQRTVPLGAKIVLDLVLTDFRPEECFSSATNILHVIEKNNPSDGDP